MGRSRPGKLTPLSDAAGSAPVPEYLQRHHRQRLRHSQRRIRARSADRHRHEDCGYAFSAAVGIGADLSHHPGGWPTMVWVPVALYLLAEAAIWKGIFLLIWGTVVVSSIDNVIRPWVISGRVELHPFVLLFFILGGVEAFGFIGLFWASSGIGAGRTVGDVARRAGRHRSP